MIASPQTTLYWGDTLDPLSREEETDLIHRWQQHGDEAARDTLVRANLRFVSRCVAAHPAARYLDSDDAMQAGAQGLLTAIDRFDASSNNVLITYAVWWIRAYLGQLLAETERPVRLPQPVRDNILALRKRQKEHPLEGEEDSIRALNLSHPAEHALRQALKTDVRLDAPLGADDPDLVSDKYVIDALAYDDVPLPKPFSHYLDTIDLEYANTAIEAHLADLSHVERAVVRLYFGLWGEKTHTLQEIGALFNLTRERIRQIKARAMAKIGAPEDLERAWSEL